MKMIEKVVSEFKDLKGIEYFKFEEDFIEENIRCIPMIVRLKLDEIGIKLQLAAWCKFLPKQRVKLAVLPISTVAEKMNYRQFLIDLISSQTDYLVTELSVDPTPAWRNPEEIPKLLKEKSAELGLIISTSQWRALTDLKRFVLLKLCRPGHENKNFNKALTEFHLLTNENAANNHH